MNSSKRLGSQQPVAWAIQTAVEQVILRESLANERRVACVKVVVVFISSILDVLVYLFPEPLMGKSSFPITVVVISVTATAVYGGFLWLLRQAVAWRWLPAADCDSPVGWTAAGAVCDQYCPGPRGVSAPDYY